jgi:hypothetical protein
MRRVCWYLGKVVLHESDVAERSTSRDANIAGYRAAPFVRIGPILELLRGEDENHVLEAIVLEKTVDVRIILRGRVLKTLQAQH